MVPQCSVWSYRADGEDVVSQIMWGFLLFIPRINLHLHLQIWDLRFTVNLFSSCGMFAGWTAEPPNAPKWSAEDHRSTPCPFNCLPICMEDTWSEKSWMCTRSLLVSLDAEQKMGSMWLFPLTELSKRTWPTGRKKKKKCTEPSFFFPSSNICILNLQSMHLTGTLAKWISLKLNCPLTLFVYLITRKRQKELRGS